MLVIQSIEKVAGASSNYRDSGTCTFGLFLHDLQRKGLHCLPRAKQAEQADTKFPALARSNERTGEA